MKGVIFTEFLEMVEERFSLATADRMLTSEPLPSGGIYTAVGTYDHQEMLELVGRLSRLTNIPAPDLVRAFGRHLFGRFTVLYPDLFTGIDSAFTLLENVEGFIHVEVLKLYPEASLPRFECRRHGPDRLEMVYRSPRPFADLAEGLIHGCAEHFGESVDVTRQDVPEPDGGAVRFLLTRRPPA